MMAASGRRAERANLSLRRYHPETEKADALTDILTDLQHLAEREGWDFEAQLALARQHYATELRGEVPAGFCTRHRRTRLTLVGCPQCLYILESR